MARWLDAWLGGMNGMGWDLYDGERDRDEIWTLCSSVIVTTICKWNFDSG